MQSMPRYGLLYFPLIYVRITRSTEYSVHIIGNELLGKESCQDHLLAQFRSLATEYIFFYG